MQGAVLCHCYVGQLGSSPMSFQQFVLQPLTPTPEFIFSVKLSPFLKQSSLKVHLFFPKIHIFWKPETTYEINSFPLLTTTETLTFQYLPPALLIILYLEIGLVMALVNQSRRLWLRNVQLHIAIIHISFKSYRLALSLCWMFSRIISALPHVSHHGELTSAYDCIDSGIVRGVLAALGRYATSPISQNESASSK